MQSWLPAPRKLDALPMVPWGHRLWKETLPEHQDTPKTWVEAKDKTCRPAQPRAGLDCGCLQPANHGPLFPHHPW